MGNKNAKDELIRKYGAECFIEKLHLRKDDEPRIYKSNGELKRMRQLTYHHIKMRKDGGPATVENGALLSAENHQWFHKQDARAQGFMNAIFQEYKRQIDECQVVFEENLNLPFEIKTTTFHIHNQKGYNRAKEKRKLKRHIDKYKYYEDDFEK